MFLWRHVAIYQKNPPNSSWRLNVHQKKPAKPVRVEGVRPAKGTVTFKRCVITPDGGVKPFWPEKGGIFVDFWREWVEIWRQTEDYQKARGMPLERYCPRCDEPMNWLRRAPAHFLYTEIEAKRRVFHRTDLRAMHDDTATTDSDSVDENYTGPLEDRYCCPNDECGIREARIEFKHNTAITQVIQGLTDKQWKPNRFGGNKIKSERAKAKLAEIPFTNRGYPIKKDLRDRSTKAPFMNSVSHAEAIAIVERNAKARYDDILKRPNFDKRPFWYSAYYDFCYLNIWKKPKEIKGIPPCDQCSSVEDSHPTACFYCGCILCAKCRDKAFPQHRSGYYPWGACPSCSKRFTKSLDRTGKKKNQKALQRLTETKKMDPRRPYWFFVLGDAYAEDTSTGRRRNAEKAKEFFRMAGELGISEAYSRLGDFYMFGETPPDPIRAKKYYKMAGQEEDLDFEDLSTLANALDSMFSKK